MEGLLDFHTHILPRMDDGSSGTEESLKMLEAEAQQGVDTVVLTPHFYASRETPERFIARRAQAFETLSGAAAGRAGLPRLLCGAEVAYYDGLSRSEQLGALCIQDTGVMLVEMPFCQWNPRMFGELAELRNQRGIQPVVAHVERYLDFQPVNVVEKLCEQGLCVQVNASFFTRWQTSRTAMRLLDERLIHFVGTDCHDMKKRSPNMERAAEKIGRQLGADALDYLQHMKHWFLEGMR